MSRGYARSGIHWHREPWETGSPQYDARRVQVGFEVDDIVGARDRLIAAGVEASSGIEGEGTDSRWAYFRDPEGNVFEIKEHPARSDGDRLQSTTQVEAGE